MYSHYINTSVCMLCVCVCVYSRYSDRACFLSFLCVCLSQCLSVCVSVCVKVSQKWQSVSSAFLCAPQNNSWIGRVCDTQTTHP